MMPPFLKDTSSFKSSSLLGLIFLLNLCSNASMSICITEIVLYKSLYFSESFSYSLLLSLQNHILNIQLHDKQGNSNLHIPLHTSHTFLSSLISSCALKSFSCKMLHLFRSKFICIMSDFLFSLILCNAT